MSATKLYLYVPVPPSLQFLNGVPLRAKTAPSAAASRRGAYDDATDSELVSEVIVETINGGVGTCTVQFRCEPLPSTPSEVLAHACKPVGVWYDELRYLPLLLPSSKREARSRPLLGTSPDENLLAINTNSNAQSSSASSSALTYDQLHTFFPKGIVFFFLKRKKCFFFYYLYQYDITQTNFFLFHFQPLAKSVLKTLIQRFIFSKIISSPRTPYFP